MIFDTVKIYCVLVNDFRRMSLEMMDGRREKLTGNQDNLVGRIEFLPVLWHSAVHDDMPTGVDRLVKKFEHNRKSRVSSVEIGRT